MILTEIEQLLRPSVESLGCEWWGCEYGKSGKHALLRIFIDKPGGVGIDDCEQVSRQVSAMLDVHELILGEYRLEISSPGIPRPLFYPSHYQRYLNHVVQIKLRQPLLGQRNFTGTIASASEEIVILMIQDTPQEFRISNIVKAFLTVERGEL